jgi:hypothetical protein
MVYFCEYQFTQLYLASAITDTLSCVAVNHNEGLLYTVLLLLGLSYCFPQKQQFSNMSNFIL